MRCSRCNAELEGSASYCHRCGQSVAGGGRNRYAVTTGESVGQPAVISTIMPHADSDALDSFRWALLVGGALILGATLAGFVPVALVSAAFLVPAAYLVYIYTVNLWQDTPLRVVLALFGLVGVASVAVSLVFFQWVFADQFRAFAASGSSGFAVPWVPLLIFAVALPIVAEVVKNIAAVLLARMPQFDDQIDGLTFGIAAGAAYAACESLVSFWPAITGGLRVDGATSWVVIVLNLMVVKTLIYGTATGLAVAAYSGRGAGYAGFTGKYVTAFAAAAGANILYWLGVRLAADAPAGPALGLLWGLVILAVLLVRLRSTLQSALVEAALEGSVPNATAGSCPECGAGLAPESQFCSTCGTSVRAASVPARTDGAGARLGRTGILGAVLAGVVAVAAAGAVIAVVDQRSEKVPTPPKVGDLFRPGKPLDPSPAPGGSAGGRLSQTVPLEQLMAQAPASLPGELVPDPGATAEPASGGGGGTIALTDDSALVVGPRWEVVGFEDGGALILQGDVTMGIFPFHNASSTDAVALVPASQEFLFGSSAWVSGEFFEAQSEQPAGRIVSLAFYGYNATWSDQQGTSQFSGIVVVAVRDDRQLLILRTMTPPSNLEQSFDVVGPVIDDALNAFAGLS